MRAGLLNEKITVYRPTTSTNEVGEQVTTYNEVATIAAYFPVNRKAMANYEGDMWSPTTRTMQVRIFQDIQDYDQIEHDGRRYKILSIESDKPLMCKRIELQEIDT